MQNNATSGIGSGHGHPLISRHMVSTSNGYWNMADDDHAKSMHLRSPAPPMDEKGAGGERQGSILWRVTQTAREWMQSISTRRTICPPSIDSALFSSALTRHGIELQCSNWASLHQALSQTLSGTRQFVDLRVVNPSFRRIPAIRMVPSAAEYRCAMRDVEKQANASALAALRNKADIPGRLDFIDEDMDGVLAMYPCISGKKHDEFSQLVSSIHAGIESFSDVIPGRFGNGKLTQYSLKKLELLQEKLRAIVLDVVTGQSFSDQNLIDFIERSFNNGAMEIYRCATECDLPRQAIIFNRSKVLAAALRIPFSIATHPLHAISSCRGRSSNAPFSVDAMPMALVRAAVHSVDAGRRHRCFCRLEKALADPGLGNAETAKADVCTALSASLAQFNDHETRRAQKIIFCNIASADARDLGKQLVGLLSVRSAIPPRQRYWADQLIGRHLGGLVFAAAEMTIDAAALATIDWIFRQIENASTSGADMVDELFAGMFAAVREGLSGVRLTSSLTKMLDLRDSVPIAPRTELLIYAAVRVAGNEVTEQIGRPDLFEQVRERELDLYPALIAAGHAFEKHVLGIANLDWRGRSRGAEFTHIFQCTGDRTKDIGRFAAHIRFVMRNPTRTCFNNDGVQHFWHEPTRTLVACNPMHPDGGTAIQYRTL